MSVIASTNHYDNNGNEWLIVLRKDGAITIETNVQLDASGEIFSLNYNQSDSLFDPIIASDFAVNFVFQNDTQFEIINDIVNSPDRQYKIYVYKNSNPVWSGYVDKGLISYIEGSYPITCTIRAVDGIGFYERIAYDAGGDILDANDEPIENLYWQFEGSIENDKFLPIKEQINKVVGFFYHNVDWTDAVVTKDVFSDIGSNDLTWQAGDDNKLQSISQKTVLEQWAKRFLGRWIKWNGAWYLQQLEGAIRNTAYRRWVRTNSSYLQSSAPSDVIATPSDFASDMQIELRPPISSSILTYEHDLQGIVRRYQENNVSNDLLFNISDYEYSSNDQVILNLQAEPSADLSGNNAYNSLTLEYAIWVSTNDNGSPSDVPTRYWDESNSGSWVIGEKYNRISSDNGKFDISIRTLDIPAEAEGGLTDVEGLQVRIKRIFSATSSDAITGSYINTNYDLLIYITGANTEDGKSTVFQANTANDGTETYDHGSLYVSDGIKPWDNKKMLLVNTETATGDWSSTGETSSAITDYTGNIDQLTVATINRFYKNAKHVIIGTLLKEYNPLQVLEHGSKKYLFGGGQITGDGYWNGIWYEATYDNEDVTFETYKQDALQSLPAGTYGVLSDVLSLKFDRKTGIEADEITRLTTAINEGDTVTSLSIVPISGEPTTALKQGQKVSLLNLRTGRSQTFTISSDYAEDDTSVSVSSSTASFDFASGSIVLLTGEALRSYILKTAQSVAIGVSSSDLQSIAEINGDVLTSANPHTSIPITNLGYPLTDGQKVRLVQAATPTNFDEVEIAADADPASQNMSIISKSLTYNYAAGDRVVFTVAQASGLLAIQVDEAAASANAALTAKNDAVDAKEGAENAEASLNLTVEGVNATTVVKSITNANGTQSIASARFDTTPTSSNITLAAENIDLVSVKNEINKIADISGVVENTITVVSISSLDIRDPLQVGDVVYLVKATNNAEFDRVVLRAILDVSDPEILVDSTTLTYSYDTGDLVVIDYQSSTALISQSVTNINSEIVLKAATSENNVATIKLEAIDGSNANTAIRLDADEITITGTTFINELMGQELTIQTGGFVSSSNFATGTEGTGWRISQTSAEFNDVTIRGTLDGADGSFSGSLSAATGTLGALSVEGAVTIGANGVISGNSYTPTNASEGSGSGFFLGRYVDTTPNPDVVTYEFGVGNGAKRLYYNGDTLTLDGAQVGIGGTGTIKTDPNALDGTVGGVVINSSGIFAGTGETSGGEGDGQTPSTANFRVNTSGALVAKSATITGGITATSLSLTGAMSFGTGGSINLANGKFTVTNEGAVTATDATITGDITATSGTLQSLDVQGTITVGKLNEDPTPDVNGIIQSVNYDASKGFKLDGIAGKLTAVDADLSGKITSTEGEIAGWIINSNKLSSAGEDVARIELDQDLKRISIKDNLNNPVVAMGFLQGLNVQSTEDPNDTYGAGTYGFWADSSTDKIVIDGNVEYESGDWLIQNNASYLIQKEISFGGSLIDVDIIRLGTYNGTKGLFFFTGQDADDETVGFQPELLGSITGTTLTLGRGGTDGQLSYSAVTGKMTIDGDVDISGTLQSVDGTFSGALSAVTGTLGALSIKGALTLGTGGSINLADNFTVDSSGNVVVSGALTAGTNSSINGIYIVDATIDNAKIADATITSAKIDEIQANKITISSVSENTLFYDNFEIEESNWILRDAVSSTIITQNIYVTISGTITQVFVFNLDYDLKVGQKIRLFKSSNPSQYDEVFVSQDVSAATGVVTINVFEKTLTYSYTSSDDIAYLVSSVDYLATESLLSAISGTITQVPVTSLADNLRAGQKIRIFKTSDKDEFDEVTVANDVTASVSSTIIPVESQALTYSYTTDDDILYTPTTYVYEEWEISNATPYAYQGDYYLRRTGSDDVDKYAFNKQRINLEYGKTEFVASVYGRTNNSLSALSNGTSIGVAFYDKYGAQLKFGYSGLFQDAHHQGTTWKELGIRVKMTNNGVTISYTDVNNTGKLSQTFVNSDIAYCYVYLYSGEFNNFFDQFKVQPVLGSVQIQDGAITADKIDVNDLFAQDANITGTLTLGSGSGNGSITSTELNMYDVTLDSSGLIVGSEASGNDFLKVTPTSFTYGNDQSGLLTIAQPTGNIAITFSNGKMFINGNEVAFV